MPHARPALPVAVVGLASPGVVVDPDDLAAAIAIGFAVGDELLAQLPGGSR